MRLGNRTYRPENKTNPVNLVLVVGNLSKHHVEITAKDSVAAISINTAKKGLFGKVLITADDNSGKIIISHSEGYKLDDHVNSLIWMSAAKKEVANILMADKKGRNDLTTEHPK